MKDIKKALSEYTVPVDESEWQQIAADARLVKYNRGRRIRRWASWGGCAIVAMAGLVAGTLWLHRSAQPTSTDAPAPIVTTEEAVQQTPALTSQPDVATMTTNRVSATTSTPSVETPSPTTVPSATTPEFIVATATTPTVAATTAVNPSHNPSMADLTQPATPVNETKTARLVDNPVRVSEPTTEITEEILLPKSSSEPAEEASSNYQIFVPNSFTPDGNGTNDLFMPKADFIVQDYEINIFSRSGQRVFTSRSIEQGWDGYSHGTLLPGGAYMYVIRYTDPDGNAKTLKGQVVLLK